MNRVAGGSIVNSHVRSLLLPEMTHLLLMDELFTEILYVSTGPELRGVTRATKELLVGLSPVRLKAA